MDITATSAIGRTFDVYELLEQILFLLSPSDIARCMRVSRKWHAIIEDSPLLKVQLFLAPGFSSTAWILRHDPTIGEGDRYPRSSYSISAIVPAPEAEASRVYETDKVCIVAEPNPRFLEIATCPPAWQSDDLNLRAANGEARNLRIPDDDIRRPRFPADSRIMRMFLTQPPATSIAIIISIWETKAWFEYDAPRERKVAKYFEMVRDDEGVRYADVLAVLGLVGKEERVAEVGLDLEGLVFAGNEDVQEAGRQASNRTS